MSPSSEYFSVCNLCTVMRRPVNVIVVYLSICVCLSQTTPINAHVYHPDPQDWTCATAEWIKGPLKPTRFILPSTRRENTHTRTHTHTHTHSHTHTHAASLHCVSANKARLVNLEPFGLVEMISENECDTKCCNVVQIFDVCFEGLLSF